jgi:hypothetical protein
MAVKVRTIVFTTHNEQIKPKLTSISSQRFLVSMLTVSNQPQKKRQKAEVSPFHLTKHQTHPDPN